jgi:glycosyltransferase involved in cell wall biosynthesis
VGGDPLNSAQSGGRLPRVLCVTVDPFSITSNNGKTFASFFQGYPRSSLAQLYFHRELPSSDLCDNYFRITDENLLSSLPFPWRTAGEFVTSRSPSTSPIPPKVHSALRRSYWARLFRQCLWKTVNLEQPILLSWLDEFRPEVIFFCGGDAAVLYSKVERLADRYGAQIVFYITDDYVLPGTSKHLAARAIRRWTRRAFRRMTTRAALVLTIGEAMSARYRTEFGFESLAVMNMVNMPEAAPPYPVKKPGQQPLSMVYAGSFHSNRWRVLADFVSALEDVAEDGAMVQLRVYGPKPDEEMLDAFVRPPVSTYGGLLNPTDLAEAISGADVLLHVESDDPHSIDVTALSISTKIPEYLAAGRPVLAIGPPEIASMKYLATTGAAVVTPGMDRVSLRGAIERLVHDPGFRARLADRAFAVAQENHDGDRNRHILWDKLRRIAS